MRGEVVVLPYPFTDLTSSKRRPVMVLATSSLNDLIVLPITSKIDEHSKLLHSLNNNDFEEGSLPLSSSIVLDKLFTISEGLVVYRVGRLKDDVYNTILRFVISFLLDGAA
jgi:mRNA interferase MazF